MSTDYRALCAEAIELWDADCDMDGVIEEMRTLLSQPQPPAGEVGELVAWLRANSSGIYRPAARIADLLEQRQAVPVPVAVSERLPGPDDCLDEGWAWFFSPRVGWRQAVLPVSAAYTHWLPAHALPLPNGKVES